MNLCHVIPFDILFRDSFKPNFFFFAAIYDADSLLDLEKKPLCMDNVPKPFFLLRYM